MNINKKLLMFGALLALYGCGGGDNQAKVEQDAKTPPAETKTVNTEGLKFKSLHDAVKAGDVDDIKEHLKRGADVNEKGYAGWTPLHRASGKEIAGLLLEKGADVNAKDEEGMTPLHMTSDKDVAGLLLEKGADIHAKGGPFGGTPLHLAAANGRKDVAELLIEKGADVNAETQHGKTPLALAEEAGQTSVVELLKAHGGK